jgi:hypothetical protein
VITGAGIRMKGCKQKHIFVEYDIPRDIYAAGVNIKALKTLVHIAIAKKTQRVERSCNVCVWVINLANKRN